MLPMLLVLAAGPVLAAAPPLVPPSAEVVQEARGIVESMQRNERGPYHRIRWFCEDGSSHPPKPYPCAERGGGRQHAEYSPERRRLAELGWHVGTVVAALAWDEIWQPERRHQRLRELPLERYLEAVDDERARRSESRIRTRGVAVRGDTLFTVTDHAHVIALNRFTGELLWDAEMADYRDHYGAVAAPMVVRDLVIAGISAGDTGLRGFLDAYDADMARGNGAPTRFLAPTIPTT